MSGNEKKAKAATPAANPKADEKNLKARIKAEQKARRIAKAQQPKGELKVPKGTARAERREGLKKGWKGIKNAAQMKPVGWKKPEPVAPEATNTVAEAA